MTTHDGFVFMSPDGRYLERRKILSHGPDDKIQWTLTKNLYCAHLFPHGSSLDNIKRGQGFDVLSVELDIPFGQFREVFTPVPAQSVQKIVIGRGK